MKRLLSVSIFSMFIAGCQLNNVIADNAIAENTPKYPEYIQSGQTLPLTSIENVDGETVDLANPEKQKLVILFATWCSDSNRALKALNESPLLNDENIEVVAIAREESKEQVLKWRDENGIKVPLAVDPDRKIYSQFAQGGIPRMITVTQDNKIIKMNLAEGENQLELIEWL
ncbi:TlpA family protein disulfide reductase [Thalassotalea fusca]